MSGAPNLHLTSLSEPSAHSPPHGADENRLPIEHHPHLYIASGDVILSAQTGIPSSGLSEPQDPNVSPKTILFRVHKAILSLHSSAFENVFLDATASAGDTYDGAPVVPMIGDRAEDLAQVLMCLYKPHSAVFRRLDPDKPRRLSGVIRLMDKYLFEEQRKYLIDQVVSDWPTTLNDWDRRQNELHGLEKYPMQEILGARPRRRDPHVPDPAVAIAFAREFGCTEILPAAFYQLSTIPLRNVFKPEATKTAEWGLLSREDLLRYMQGSQSLWSSGVPPDELLGDECRAKYKEHVKSIMNCGRIGAIPQCLRHIEALLSMSSENGRYGAELPADKLRFLADMIERWGDEDIQVVDELCEDCFWSFSDNLARMREDVWKDLPRTFALDS